MASDSAPPSGRGGSVVVADDDRITRELVARMLRGRGYDVETVADGQAAVERVARGGVHLVLLDVLMPRLGGLEACRLLKSMTSGSFLPVVLVTVKTDSASRVEGLRIGADDYVCKPFDENELVARVEAMLRIKRLHDHVAEARQRLEQLSIHVHGTWCKMEISRKQRHRLIAWQCRLACMYHLYPGSSFTIRATSILLKPYL
jgi:DNA-binding response OmpR family regulator